jgi:hypothetical protein
LFGELFSKFLEQLAPPSQIFYLQTWMSMFYISLINFNFFNPMYKGLMYGTQIKIKLRLLRKYTHFPTLTSYIADVELSTPCRINSCTSFSLDKGCTWKTKKKQNTIF